MTKKVKDGDQTFSFLNAIAKYGITVGRVVIYWYDVQKAFNRSTKCSPTLYLMAITTADCFTATRIELNSAGSVSVRHLCTVCVGVLFTLCVTKTDKCNSGEERAPPPTPSHLPPL